MDELLDHLAEALEAVDPLVAGVTGDRWSRPTPCTAWSVRDLVEHVVGGHRTTAAVVRGAPTPSPEDGGPGGFGVDPLVMDPLGADPLGAYRAAAYDVLAAFREPCVLTRSFSLPVGTVPGVVALQLRIVEALVHGSDLGRATGRCLPVREHVARLALDFSARTLADLPPGRRPFAPPRPVAPDAPALERLEALLGRRTESEPGRPTRR